MATHGTNSGGLLASPGTGQVTQVGTPTWWNQSIYTPPPRVRPTSMESFINQIVREEINLVQNLDMERMDKLLQGNREDLEVAVEILKAKTKYLWRIVQELKVNNTSIEDLDYIVRDYMNRNLINLNLRKELK